MTDEERNQEGAEHAIEDLEAPAAVWADVAGGMACKLPTYACEPAPTCTAQTFCSPGTVQQCHLPTCAQSLVRVA